MKKISMVLVVLVVSYLAIGWFTLLIQSNNVDAKTGTVWVQIQRAGELLPRLETQVTFYAKDRQDLIQKIADARANLAATNKSNSNLAAAERDVTTTLQAFMEAYPALSLEGVQVGLLDETSGSMNRISYARQELIEAQTSYNNTRSFFYMLGMFVPRMEILGENADPTATIAPSTLG